VARYLSLDEHSVLPDVLLISTHIWNGLSTEEQNWLQKAADDSAIYQRELWHAAEEEALRVVAEDGVTIVYPDKSAFQNVTSSLYEPYRNSEPEFFKLIEDILNTQVPE
jgi:TRAP-type C4-dicarboxylate transport system substrate-binding protein